MRAWFRDEIAKLATGAQVEKLSENMAATAQKVENNSKESISVQESLKRIDEEIVHD